MAPFRIVTVDDSALFRMMLRNVIKEIPNCELVASISDSTRAAEQIESLSPDLVTLDVEMPEVDGIAVLRQLKRRKLATKVIMISRFTTSGAQVTTDALIEGAFDFIVKPSTGNPAETKALLRAELIERIDALRETSSPELQPKPVLFQTSPTRSGEKATSFGALLIGCSTGGPDALAKLIPELPADLPVPVIVIQHMPEKFTSTLAARLDEASELTVVEAEEGMLLSPGKVILARGGKHLELRRQGFSNICVRLTDDPPEQRVRPAVDYTFRSAVSAFDQPLLAVILTGMGRDGTLGCELVHRNNGHVLVQAPDGCTVFGMPKSVLKAELADQVVPLEQMARKIQNLLKT
ncbi:chemotaxis-specific protein-glutamate methyltransferase CheB [Lacunimicrobium album]